MTTETFEKAQELNLKIEDIDTALQRIASNEKNCNGLPLNFSFNYEEEFESLKRNVITYLTAKKSKLKREFDGLK